MKLFVLGSGYVGIPLLAQLRDKQHVLYASTTREEKADVLKTLVDYVVISKGSDKERLKEVIDLCDGMIILVAPKNADNYEETYLLTAKTIVEVLKDRDRPFYLLYTSSTSVYESLRKEWVYEEDRLQPQSFNAKILVETEKLYLGCSNKYVTSCILRLGGIYGPNRDLKHRAKRYSGKDMQGSGQEPTNHIHLVDIISGIEYCLSQHLKGVYNLVNEDHPTRRELYTTLCTKMGLQAPRWIEHSSLGELSRYQVSNKKIKQAGFEFNLETAIEDDKLTQFFEL